MVYPPVVAGKVRLSVTKVPVGTTLFVGGWVSSLAVHINPRAQSATTPKTNNFVQAPDGRIPARTTHQGVHHYD